MLHLASRSPRRRALLARLGVPFAVRDVDVDERPAPGEDALAYVQRVAGDKARAAWCVLGGRDRDGVTTVLAADTEVVLDGEVFGKPADDADASRMLRRLAGRTHLVHSAVVLVADGRRAATVSTTEVAFAPLSAAAIDAYVATGDPMGKAGGYAIQGGAERFVARLCGSYSGVMGLPLFETAVLLEGFGIALPAMAPADGGDPASGPGTVDPA